MMLRGWTPIIASVVVLVLLAVSAFPFAIGFESPSTLTPPAATVLAKASTTWKPVFTGGVHPTGRYAAAMSYDPLDGYVVLFGGVRGAGTLFGDTWTYHNGTWTRLIVPHPSNRSGASMVYDPAAGYLLLFGGLNDSQAGGVNHTQVLNDTWKFVHGNWTKLNPAHPPPPRTLAVSSYEAGSQSVLLGGGWNIQRNLSDMWSFHGGNWSQILVAPGQPFHGRFSSMAYDAGDRYVVYFGDTGFAGNATWNYSAGNWTKLSPPLSPPAMFWMSLAFDPQLRLLVVFGTGFNFGVGFTWGFHGGHWLNLSPFKQAPARWAAAMTYDGADGYLLLFGGYSYSTGALHDTWRLV